MSFIRWLFGRRKPLIDERLSHDGRAWQRNTFPRFKHFSR